MTRSARNQFTEGHIVSPKYIYTYTNHVYTHEIATNYITLTLQSMLVA